MMLRHFSAGGGKLSSDGRRQRPRSATSTEQGQVPPALNGSKADCFEHCWYQRSRSSLFLKLVTAPDAIMVNNERTGCRRLATWKFLRDYGVHFTINTNDQQETVERRCALSSPTRSWSSTTMLLQGYNFLDV